MFFFHKDEQNALKSLKKVILSRKSLENHSQICVRTLKKNCTFWGKNGV